MSPKKLRIGVSACLLGQSVRFNGGHCRDRFLLEHVKEFAEFVPVCPEVEIGLGTPRETLRLSRADGLVQLTAPKSGTDLTAPMTNYAKEKVNTLKKTRLHGFVLKKNSPSCGMERVKVYDSNGAPSRSGRGVFAEALMRDWPNLPVEEEGRLKDYRLRENFFERVFAYARLQDFFDSDWTGAQLVEFHTAEKLLLMSHSPDAYRKLGRLVAGYKPRDRQALADEYVGTFMRVLAERASRKLQTAVLERIAGYFKTDLDGTAKAEYASLVLDYKSGLVPLAVPLTLVRHYARQFRQAYIARQTYLSPHPKELMLRSFV